MAKTYKTAPTWVKLRRDHKARREVHYHENGECTLEDWLNSTETFPRWKSYRCHYSVSYYRWHEGFFDRPRRGKYYRLEFEGRARANWRKERDDMLKLNREDLEDYDTKTYQHRHSALWEIW